MHFPSIALLFGPVAYKVEIVSTSDTNTVKQPELGCVDFRNTSSESSLNRAADIKARTRLY